MKNILIFITYFLVLNFTKAQIISTVAGSGTSGAGGDGSQAITAQISNPQSVAFDSFGNMYIADASNNKIRKVSTLGIITTFAGNGTAGYSGDGGQATAAELSNPIFITFDPLNNLFIVEHFNHVIRKVTPSGIITTIAGNGLGGYSGDSGPATAAEFNEPSSMAIDDTGNIYVADSYNNVIRKINTLGVINTYAGNGIPGYSGDGGIATSAKLNFPFGVAFDRLGNLYVADHENEVIRKINSTNIISTIVGNGTQGYSGDGGMATAAQLYYPACLTFDISGNMYIADDRNNVIRKVDTSGIITTIVGNGIAGFSGDNGTATSAKLNAPNGITLDNSGNIYIADWGNNRIRKVTNVANVGISQILSLTSQISLYPNPSSGIINITSSNNINELKVTDLLGQLIYEAKPNATNATLTLDNAGIYFVTINAGIEVSTQKLIVNK